MNGKTKFLNVDLELRAADNLDALIEAFEPFAFPMDYDAGTWVSLELNDDPQSAADAIKKFSEAVASLPAENRAAWDSLQSRVFNIGIHSGAKPEQSFFRLPLDAIERVHALKAEVIFTVYGADADFGAFE